MADKKNILSYAEPNKAGVRMNLDASKFHSELFCLKRDFQLSNLPQTHAIRVVAKASSGEKLKVAEVNLFDPNGNLHVLEMWNDSATEGVKWLWRELADEDEILLRFQDLDPDKPAKDRRVYKSGDPTHFQRNNKTNPATKRIAAKGGSLGQFCDLSRQCRRIKINSYIQLVNGKQPMRDFALWYQTIEAQEQEDDPDELQQLIFQTLGKHPADMDEESTEVIVKKPKKVNSSSNNNNSTNNAAAKKKSSKAVDGVEDNGQMEKDTKNDAAPSASRQKMEVSVTEDSH